MAAAERGNHRGLTTWQSLYLEPAQGPQSPVKPVAKTVFGVLLAELLIVGLVRRNVARGASRS